jgi:uncharacterized protein (TIRG00374 family)
MNPRSVVRRFGGRVVSLAICAISLYIVAPSLLTLLDAWPQLGGIRPAWFLIIVVLETCSFACLWLLLRIALPAARWRDIVTSQLAGNAAGRIIPGGAATGAVIQGRMLIVTGHPSRAVGLALSATGAMTTGMLFVLPVLSLPTLVFGQSYAHQLEVGLVASLVVATVLIAVGLCLLTWHSLVYRVGLVAGHVVHLVKREITPQRVAASVVRARGEVAAAFRGRWVQSLACAAGNRMFDYATLVGSLLAVGAQARPDVVLLAYVVSMALAVLPITPGGLGLVEAGLTTLLVVAGVSTDQAVLATLLYRLASYWVPILFGGFAWAGWRLDPARNRASSAT